MRKRKGRRGREVVTRSSGPVSFEVRLRMVREVLRGASQLDVATAFGVSGATVQKFMALYRSGGVEALRPRISGAAALAVERAAARRSEPRHRAVVELRKEHEDWGTRRIRDVLARFSGLGVSETEVRRILHEEGLIPEAPPERPAREHGPRRFERAEPNQLWQSDIFTFLLRRHERLYLTAFMDDHSRYVVSYALARHQRAELVLEALERGIATYGTPREILTDQGRQYTAWRGTTDFERELKRHGIEHIKSRPQHPQTVGKVERFWKTLWDEFLSRTVFADYTDCDRRLALFIQHYNFQRPHQALDGLVPADRFFRAAAHVRAAVEKTIEANALRLAREQQPRKPFYLVGRLGDQDLSIAALAGKLAVRMGDAEQTITLPKEDDHEPQTTRAFPEDERSCGPAAEAPAATDPEVADRTAGPGRRGETPVPHAAQRAVGGEASERGNRGARAFAWDALQARDQGARGDAPGAGAGRGRGGLAGGGDDDAADRGARSEGGAPRAGEAARRAPALPGAEARAAGPGDDGGGAAAGVALDERWARTFAVLADDGADERAGAERFDPEAGWSDDALTWERKLAGAIASCEGEDEEVADGAEATTERAAELSPGAQGADGAGAAAGAHQAGPGGEAHHGGGGAPGGDQPEQLPDPRAQGRGRDGGGDPTAAERAEAALAAGARARGGGRGPEARDPRAVAADLDDRPPPRSGGRAPQGEASSREDAELASLLAELDGLIEGRGPGADGGARGGGEDA